VTDESRLRNRDRVSPHCCFIHISVSKAGTRTRSCLPSRAWARTQGDPLEPTAVNLVDRRFGTPAGLDINRGGGMIDS
jgi:hypothetical protein